MELDSRFFEAVGLSISVSITSSGARRLFIKLEVETFPHRSKASDAYRGTIHKCRYRKLWSNLLP